MKQKNIKILIALIAIILVLGTIVICIKGLNFELKYQENDRIEINLGKEFNEADIREITNTVFENQPLLIQAIEMYKDSISIRTTQITDKQKESLITKINEKYQTELTVDNIEVEKIAHVRGRDIIKPFIAPFAIVTLIILIYIAIRYNKLNSFKVLIQSIGIIILSQLVLLGIMSITRMPIGKFTIPAVLLVYMFSTYICTAKFENDLEKMKTEIENK